MNGLGKKAAIVAFLGICIIIVGFEASAYPIYVKPLDGGSLQPNTIWEYAFNFSMDSSCTDIILTNTSNITTGNDGIGFIDIDITGLTTKPQYLCEYRNGSLRLNKLFSDQILNTTWHEKVYSNDWTNVTITESQISDLSAGNPFNQSLNTTDNVTFDVINATEINTDSDTNIGGDVTIAGTSINITSVAATIEIDQVTGGHMEISNGILRFGQRYEEPSGSSVYGCHFLPFTSTYPDTAFLRIFCQQGDRSSNPENYETASILLWPEGSGFWLDNATNPFFYVRTRNEGGSEDYSVVIDGLTGGVYLGRNSSNAGIQGDANRLTKWTGISIGDGARVGQPWSNDTGNLSVCIGPESECTGDRGVAVGYKANSSAECVALGPHANCTEPLTANIRGFRIVELADGTDAQDAVTKSQLETVNDSLGDQPYVNETGDTMTGALVIQANAPPALDVSNSSGNPFFQVNTLPPSESVQMGTDGVDLIEVVLNGDYFMRFRMQEMDREFLLFEDVIFNFDYFRINGTGSMEWAHGAVGGSYDASLERLTGNGHMALNSSGVELNSNVNISDSLRVFNDARVGNDLNVSNNITIEAGGDFFHVMDATSEFRLYDGTVSNALFCEGNTLECTTDFLWFHNNDVNMTGNKIHNVSTLGIGVEAHDDIPLTITDTLEGSQPTGLDINLQGTVAVGVVMTFDYTDISSDGGNILATDNTLSCDQDVTGSCAITGERYTLGPGASQTQTDDDGNFVITGSLVKPNLPIINAGDHQIKGFHYSPGSALSLSGNANLTVHGGVVIDAESTTKLGNGEWNRTALSIGDYSNTSSNWNNSYAIHIQGGAIKMDNDCGIPSAVFWAEEGGSLSTGTSGGKQFSYGNGDVGLNGIAQPCRGMVITTTMNCQSDTALSDGVVQLMNNGSAIGSTCAMTTTDTGNVPYYNRNCNYQFGTGDVIGFITTTSDSGAVGCVPTMWVRYE